MLTPFSDTAVKKYAPAVQPKKLAGPEQMPLGDPNAPGPAPVKPPPAGPIQPAQPVGPITDRSNQPPLGSPSPDVQPIRALAGQMYGTTGFDAPAEPLDLQPMRSTTPEEQANFANVRSLAGAAGLAPSGEASGQSPEEIAKARHDYEVYKSEGGNAAGVDALAGRALDASGGASPYTPVLGSPPAADLPPPSGDLALGDPNAAAPLAGRVAAAGLKQPPAPTGAPVPAPGSNPIALGDPNAPGPTPAGQIYGPGNYPVTPPDFNTIGGQDVAEAKMPGYVWHHNGQNWDLRPSGMTGAGAAGAGGAGPAAPQSLEDVLSGKLRDVMGRSEVPGRDDPAIAGALAANRLSEQRGAERARAMLAESAAREGGGADSGALRTAKMGLGETRSAREGQFAANTILNETKSRRDELQNVLALTGNMLDAKEKNKIQQELGRLNAEVSRYGISEGGRQFDVGLTEKQREFNIDDLFRNKGLAESAGQASAARGEAARQFDTRTAQGQAQWEAEYNRQSFLDLLGSLGY